MTRHDQHQDTGAELVASSGVAAGEAERVAVGSAERCSLSALRAARAKMAPGEWAGHWKDELSEIAEAIDHDDDAAGIVATHNAADVLIEIAEAALALVGPSQVNQAHLPEFNALIRALAKVNP